MRFNLKPLITEKTMIKAPDGVYVFFTSSKVNKQQIKEKIENEYKVNVDTVNTVNIKGKIKFYRGHKGKLKDMKKAVVTLKKGERIKGFSEILAENKGEKK